MPLPSTTPDPKDARVTETRPFQDGTFSQFPEAAGRQVDTGDGSGRRLRRGVPWGRLVLLAGVGLAGAGYLYRTELRPYAEPVLKLFMTPAKEARARILSVRAVPATRQDVTISLEALGTVTAFKTVTIRSRVEGELLRVAFAEGENVEQGQLLAEIDPRAYQNQLEQAEAQFERDTAAHAVARQTLVRLRRLLETKTATPQQVDEQIAIEKQASAVVESDIATIATAKLQLSYCRIESPLTGRIGLRLVDAGNMVRPTDSSGLAVITQLRPIAVVFTIPQDEIHRVQKQMAGGQPVVVDVYGRDLNNKLATGELAALDNQVDSATGTIRLKAVFPNDDDALFPNQFVNIRLRAETLQNVVVVPNSAVQRGPGFRFVYVVNDDETAELRKVTIAATEGPLTVISEGIEAGEKVVTEGIDRLQPGAKVSLEVKGNKRPPADQAAEKRPLESPSAGATDGPPSRTPAGETRPSR